MAGKARDYIDREHGSQGIASESPSTALPPSLVLDTNVALDWLLFQDPSMAAIATAVMTKRVRWLATRAMRDELDHVLRRGLAVEHDADVDEVLARWDRHALVCASRPTQALRCGDPDDQKFVDLALTEGARWLVSRDREVLRLSRRAAPRTLIVAPAHWVLDG